MIELKKITEDIFDKIIDLDVAEAQKNFVAPNTYSLAQAYVALTNRYSIPMPFAIYKDDSPVGFLMLSYNEKDLEDPTDETVYMVWRFMIDEKHQGKGYGKAAMIKALDYIKTFPHGPATAIILSYEPENKVARKMYADFGFVETGEKFDDELVAKLTL